MTRSLRSAVGSWRFLVGVALVVGGVGIHAADKDKNSKSKTATEDVLTLHIQIEALDKLYLLEPTEPQLKALAGLAEKTAAKMPEADPIRTSADFRKALAELRDALAEDDDDKIAEAREKVDKLQEAEKIEFEDRNDITDEAIKVAAQAMRLLSPAQIVSYLHDLEDEVPEPVERVWTALEEGQDEADKDWKESRDDAAEEVGWLVAGFDNDETARITDEVRKLLDKEHRLKGEELKKEKERIEKEIRKIVGDYNPVDVLQNYMIRDLAELLSNPQLPAAIQARLKAAKE
jgi:hypothetical protein